MKHLTLVVNNESPTLQGLDTPKPRPDRLDVAIEERIMHSKLLHYELATLSNEVKNFLASLPPITHEGTLQEIIATKMCKQ